MGLLDWLFGSDEHESDDPTHYNSHGINCDGDYDPKHDLQNMKDRDGNEIPDSSPCDRYWEFQDKIDL